MSSDITKWGKIPIEVNNITCGGVVWEGPACKHKWQSTMSLFKRIEDCHKGTRRNEEEYFIIFFVDRRKEVYSTMYEFLMTRFMLPSPSPAVIYSSLTMPITAYHSYTIVPPKCMKI